MPSIMWSLIECFYFRRESPETMASEEEATSRASDMPSGTQETARLQELDQPPTTVIQDASEPRPGCSKDTSSAQLVPKRRMSSPDQVVKRPWQDEVGSSVTKEEGQRETKKVYVPSAGLNPCLDEECLIEGTPPVGLFPLAERPMRSSLVGLAKGGASYKMGRGKVTEGAVNGAYKLLKREPPQVKVALKLGFQIRDCL